MIARVLLGIAATASFFVAPASVRADADPAVIAPVQIGDLNLTGANTPIQWVVPVPGTDQVFLSASTPEHGTELWVTDGSAENTLLIDINPGSASSAPHNPVAHAGRLYFTANTPATGLEMFVSDGTVSGTVVIDLMAGPTGSSPGPAVSTAFDLYLLAQTPANGRQIVQVASNNTFSVPSLLDDGVTLPTLLTLVPGDPTDPTDDELAYVAQSASDGREVRRFNPLGPDPVIDAQPGSGNSNPSLLVAAGEALYFRASVSFVSQLVRVPDFHDSISFQLPGFTNPNQLVVGGSPTAVSRPVFAASATAVSAVANATSAAVPVYTGTGVTNLTAIGSKAVFQADSAMRQTNGTLAGTGPVLDDDGDPVDLRSLGAPYAGNAFLMTFVRGSDDVDSLGLYDPGAGTVFRRDALQIASGPPAPVYSSDLDAWFFPASDTEHGSELRQANNDGNNVQLVADLDDSTNASDPEQFVELNGRVLFVADIVNNAQQVWSHDPTTNTTTVLPGPPSQLDVIELTATTDHVWFSKFLAVDDVPFLRTDGTTVTEITGSFAGPDLLTAVGDTLLFSAFEAGGGPTARLYRASDDSATATLVSNFGGVGAPRAIVPFANGALVAVGSTFSTARTLWFTDGTPAGTTMIADVFALTGNTFSAQSLTAVDDDTAAFVHSDPTGAIWTTDGTPAGTGPLTSGVLASTDVNTIGAANGTLYAGGITGLTTQALLAIDGTSLTATTIATDILASANLTKPTETGAAIPYDPSGTTGVLLTDGTLAGTSMLAVELDSPESFEPYADGYYYHGAENNDLWWSDGTNVTSIPDHGPSGSAWRPEQLTVIGGTMYLAGRAGSSIDIEPWKFELPPRTPLSPTLVTAVAGTSAGTVTVSWLAPNTDRNRPITGYTVTASPGGATCPTTGALSCSITGLTPGATYSFTVAASGPGGASPSSVPSAALTIPGGPNDPNDPGVPDAIVPVSPARFLDTRDEATFDGQFRNTGVIAAGTFQRIQIAGRGNIPADAEGVVANATVIFPDNPGFATLYPCGAVPNVSLLNYFPGDVLANGTTVPLDPTGGVCLYSLANAHYALDINGYVPANAPTGLIEPARYLDTRGGTDATFDNLPSTGEPVAAGTSIEIQIAGRGAVPTGATAAIVNLTAVFPDNPGFLTLYPCGTVPTTSTLNYFANTVTPNGAITPLSATGTICIYTLANAHVLVDVNGYLPTGVTTLTTQTPARLLDTRDFPTIDNQYRNGGRVDGGTHIEIQITGRNNIPTNATAAILNLGIVYPDGPGFATLYPCGDLPNASTLNHATAGTVRANNAITKLSPTGTICIYTLSTTDLILDTTGYLT